MLYGSVLSCVAACYYASAGVMFCLVRPGKNTEQMNPLITTLKPQSNGPLQAHINTVIGTLAVDG